MSSPLGFFARIGNAAGKSPSEYKKSMLRTFPDFNIFPFLLQFFSRYAKIIATGLAASINAAVIEMSGFVFQVQLWSYPNY